MLILPEPREEAVQVPRPRAALGGRLVGVALLWLRGMHLPQSSVLLGGLQVTTLRSLTNYQYTYTRVTFAFGAEEC